MRSDDWLDDDRDKFSAQRTFKRAAGGMLQAFLIKLLLTLASIGAVFWGYTYFSTKLLQDVANISADAQTRLKNQAKAAQLQPAQPQTTRHDEAIAQFRLQEQMELARRNDKREAAWQKYFKPSQKCLDDSSVECANTYIRAKRAFNDQYKD